MFNVQMKKYSKCITFISILLILGAFDITQGNAAQTSPVLLYSTTKDIRMVNATRSSKLKPKILVKNLTDSTALDFYYAENKFCWVDHGTESVQCGEYNGTDMENKVEIISSEVISPDGLACDWFTGKLYWSDSEVNRIEVATMKEKYRKVLFWSDLDQPRAIALVPMKGLMFWTDWGEIPKIERASMDGNPSTRKTIVSDDIFWPNGLSIDYESELIYWIDGRLFFIDVMDFFGKNRRRVVRSGFEYPFALTRFQNKLYWTDWQTWSIHVYDQNSTDSPKEFIHSDLVPMDIHVWDAQKQPYSAHPCEKENGGCSHLCLLSEIPPGYSCACPIGIKLVDNYTCADGPQEILLLAKRSDICVIYLDSPDYSHRVLNLSNVKYSIAVDYDPIDDYIYWTDEEGTKIQRAKLDGSQQEGVLNVEIQSPDGIAIDWVARNIYWTDTGTDRIEVSTLNGKYRKVIISDGLVEPRALAVAPMLGWMFWSDWYEKKPKIERSNLDGSEREIIIANKLGWPNGVTLDFETNKIYWCDAKTDKIEFSNMDGTDRRVLINDNVPHPFGLSLMGDYLYWTDWQRRAIDRVHKETGSNRELILEQMANIMGLKAVKLKHPTGSNPCSINNGGCAHICLYRNNKTYICACQINYELTKDNHNCVIPDAFLLYTKKDSIGRISIENGGNEITLPLTGAKQISSVDYDVKNMRIYWSDSKLKTIMRAYINGSDPHRVVDLGLAFPQGIAVDWVAQNIYWAEFGTHRIEVARLGGSSRRVLLWRDVDEPHSITLDPSEGYMYWSEWGHSNKLKKSAMDGSNTKVLIMNTGFATGLTLDFERKRLYWAETSTPAIISADFNGLNKRTLVNDGITKPIGLSLYKDLILWGDESNKQIWQIDKISGSNRTLVYTLTDSATDLLVIKKPIETIANECAVNNGNCSHLCLVLPGQNPGDPVSHICACPTHYQLQNNTCVPPKKFMIYSQRNLAVRLLPDTSDCPEAVLPIQGLKAVKAIDYDPLQHYLYWVEGKSLSIKGASATGTRMSVLVPNNQNLHPFDIAIDSLGRLLFWTCAVQDVINVTRIDNSSTVGVVVSKHGEKPRLLAIHPTLRLLFYTDVGTTPQLIRTRLDGSQRIVITKGSDITAVAVDAENDLVVWAQGHSIHMCNIDGDNQHVLLNESNSKVTQLTVHSGWLYWLDREIQQLQRLELKTGGSRSVVLNHASHILDLVSVKQPDRNHSCVHKKCSHLCIVNGTNAVCTCPQGLALQEDKKTCFALPDCGNDYFTCSTHARGSKDCIPIKWRCDSQDDCPDGSDEAGCPACKENEFRCQSGLCIDQKFVCDGISQCGDNSDEARCCKKSSEFQCPRTDVCISINLLCDGTENCADGADESKVICSKYITSPKTGSSTIYIVIFSIISALVGFIVVYVILRKKFAISDVGQDQSEDPLNPAQTRIQMKSKKLRKGIPDVVHMSMLNGSQSLSYDRNNITGASSSTNGSSSTTCYPRETLNPPPSPATTTHSTRANSPNSRYRPYRHYRAINQPPPPTPCSTDVADESDYNYPTRRYDGGPFPPPPTPRSHCHSESCPPSPSSRSSTYFSPLPPPPSPVASPQRGYDS